MSLEGVLTYMDGFITLKVYDITQAFEVVQNFMNRYGAFIDVKLSTWDYTVEIGVNSFTIDRLILLLRELQPLCTPLPD